MLRHVARPRQGTFSTPMNTGCPEQSSISCPLWGNVSRCESSHPPGYLRPTIAGSRVGRGDTEVWIASSKSLLGQMWRSRSGGSWRKRAVRSPPARGAPSSCATRPGHRRAPDAHAGSRGAPVGNAVSQAPYGSTSFALTSQSGVTVLLIGVVVAGVHASADSPTDGVRVSGGSNVSSCA